MNFKKTDGTVLLRISDSSSIEKLLLRAGLPVSLEQKNNEEKGLPIFEFEFYPGIGKLVCAVEQGLNKTRMTLEVTAVDTFSSTNRYCIGHVTKHVTMVDPSKFPKWNIDSVVKIDVSSLLDLERGLIPKGSAAEYTIFSASNPWLNSQVEMGTLDQFGQYCIMPTFTRDYLLFLKKSNETGLFELNLFIFLN